MDTPVAVTDETAFKIVYYCKDCDKLVQGNRIGRKFAYKCAVCGTKNVAFGTEKSIRNFYNVK